MISYYIESLEDNSVVWYYDRLKDAQADLKTSRYYDFRIVKMIGQYKYEGYHQYYMYYDGEKFTKELVSGSLAKNKLRG